MTNIHFYCQNALRSEIVSKSKLVSERRRLFPLGFKGFVFLGVFFGIDFQSFLLDGRDTFWQNVDAGPQLELKMYRVKHRDNAAIKIYLQFLPATVHITSTNARIELQVARTVAAYNSALSFLRSSCRIHWLGCLSGYY